MSRIKSFLQECIENRNFSCVSYAIGSSKQMIERDCFGHLYWGGPPITGESLFDLASVTKPIAILPLLFSLEEGKISLDDPIALFLKEYEDTPKADITIRQLLTHTSGIPGQQPLYKEASTSEELMRLVKGLQFTYKTGTYVEYSSQGFMLLGQLIEAIEAKSLEVVLGERIFSPLGMNSTMFNPPSSIRENCVATELCLWRGKLIQGQVHDENAVVLGGVQAHAGLFSNSNDLMKLCQMILHAHQGNGTNFLKRSTVALMGKNHTNHLNLARGLGWQAKDMINSPSGDYFSETSYGHTGFTGTSIWIDPANDLFTILLTNRIHPSRENDSITRIRSIFHNLAYFTGKGEKMI